MDDLLRDFAKAGNVLPADAMQRAAGRWDEVAPALLARLEQFAAGGDQSDEAASALFFILFLAAQMREARAFQPLCRLARDGEAMESVLGDGVTTSLSGMLADTYDGDLETLLGVAEAIETDEYVRHAAFGAFTLLVALGRIDRDTAEARLRDLYARMKARRDPDSMAWVGWQEAVALLGFEALRPMAHEIFSRGLIDRTFMGRRHFDQDLQEGLAATTQDERLALLARHDIAPTGDAVALLSTWHGFSEEAQEQAAVRERREAQEKLDAALAGTRDVAPRFPLPAPPPPESMRHRNVGRNDPCPCGSGKKFKKCCLAA